MLLKTVPQLPHVLTYRYTLVIKKSQIQYQHQKVHDKD